MQTLRDQAAIVGIGQTPFSKGLGRTEFDMAVEAIHAACEDAGLSPHDIDGVARFDMESTDEEKMFSTFPMDCLSKDELSLFTERAWERFRANLYQSEGTPVIGMLVFDDAEGITAFTDYMLDNHSELRYEAKDEGSS